MFAGRLHHAPGGIHTISILNQLARGYRPANQSGSRLHFYVAATQRESRHLRARRHI